MKRLALLGLVIVSGTTTIACKKYSDTVDVSDYVGGITKQFDLVGHYLDIKPYQESQSNTSSLLISQYADVTATRSEEEKYAISSDLFEEYSRQINKVSANSESSALLFKGVFSQLPKLEIGSSFDQAVTIETRSLNVKGNVVALEDKTNRGFVINMQTNDGTNKFDIILKAEKVASYVNVSMITKSDTFYNFTETKEQEFTTYTERAGIYSYTKGLKHITGINLVYVNTHKESQKDVKDVIAVNTTNGYGAVRIDKYIQENDAWKQDSEKTEIFDSNGRLIRAMEKDENGKYDSFWSLIGLDTWTSATFDADADEPTITLTGSSGALDITAFGKYTETGSYYKLVNNVWVKQADSIKITALSVADKDTVDADFDLITDALSTKTVSYRLVHMNVTDLYNITRVNSKELKNVNTADLHTYAISSLK